MYSLSEGFRSEFISINFFEDYASWKRIRSLQCTLIHLMRREVTVKPSAELPVTSRCTLLHGTSTSRQHYVRLSYCRPSWSSKHHVDKVWRPERKVCWDHKMVLLTQREHSHALCEGVAPRCPKHKAHLVLKLISIIVPFLIPPEQTLR